MIILVKKNKKVYVKKIKNGHDPLEHLTAAMDSWDGRDELPAFTLRQISLNETLQLISRLGNSTAHGRDKLDALSLKCAADYLAPKIRRIINSSLSQGRYIMKWKTAKVIPILKSREASHLQPSSYRPISLLPVLSKGS